MLAALEDDPAGWCSCRWPAARSVGRIPTGRCAADRCRDQLPAGQLLDRRGLGRRPGPRTSWASRDTASPCDIGAVQAGCGHEPPDSLSSRSLPSSWPALTSGPALQRERPDCRRARVARASACAAVQRRTRGPLDALRRPAGRHGSSSDRGHAADASPGCTAGSECVHHVPVDQIGDVEHRWGFLYDERDGTGAGHSYGAGPAPGGGVPTWSPAVRRERGLPEPSARPQRHRRGRADRPRPAATRPPRRTRAVAVAAPARAPAAPARAAARPRRGRARTLRRVGVLPVVAPGHRVRPTRTRTSATSYDADADRRPVATGSRRIDIDTASGTTPTTCSSPSSAATGRSPT